MGIFGFGTQDRVEDIENVDRANISATGAALGLVNRLIKDVQDPKQVPETDTQLPAEQFIYNRVRLALNQARSARKRAVNLNDLYPDHLLEFNFNGKATLVSAIGVAYKQLGPLIKEQQDAIDTAAAALNAVTGPVQKTELLKKLNIAKAALNIASQKEEGILELEKKVEEVNISARRMIKQAA